MSEKRPSLEYHRADDDDNRIKRSTMSKTGLIIVTRDIEVVL